MVLVIDGAPAAVTGVQAVLVTPQQTRLAGALSPYEIQLALNTVDDKIPALPQTNRSHSQ